MHFKTTYLKSADRSPGEMLTRKDPDVEAEKWQVIQCLVNHRDPSPGNNLHPRQKKDL